MTTAVSNFPIGTTSAPKFIFMTARRKPFLTATGDHTQSHGLLRRGTLLERMLLLKARSAPASPEKDIAWQSIHLIDEMISVIMFLICSLVISVFYLKDWYIFLISLYCIPLVNSLIVKYDVVFVVYN